MINFQSKGYFLFGCFFCGIALIGLWIIILIPDLNNLLILPVTLSLVGGLLLIYDNWDWLTNEIEDDQKND